MEFPLIFIFNFKITRNRICSSEEVKRIVTPITHRPVDDIARIHFGKEFSYQGLNGQISGFQMIFGDAGYVHDTDSLEAAKKSQFEIPQDKILVATKYLFYEGERVKAQNEYPSQIEWPDQFKFELDYSIFGSFGYDAKKLATPNNIIMRLTNNKTQYIKFVYDIHILKFYFKTNIIHELEFNINQIYQQHIKISLLLNQYIIYKFKASQNQISLQSQFHVIIMKSFQLIFLVQIIYFCDYLLF